MALQNEQLEDLFHAAVALEEPERSSFVQDVLRRDQELGEELRDLVQADATAAEQALMETSLALDLRLSLILDAATQREDRRAREGQHSDPLIGTTVDNYRIVKRLGGGAAAVLLR